MSRIFLSHSSADEFEAIAIKRWLMDNGWDDVFLDIDPLRGLAAGERWQEALRRAADRCEAVLFVVSPAWAKSKWCLTEFLLAKSLHKLIFSIVLKDVPIGELPTEMKAEWQLSHLTGQGTTETIRFTHRGKPAEIAFLADGLTRLRSGLQGAGLKADFFPWPPKGDESRSPYRGLEPLDAEDAAVFFGRDTEILQGLDRLRGMCAAGDQGLFVILGASGAGKSSFLRAGLLPRLARDDRHFFPLEAIRPERNPLNGERGLASSLSKANRRLQITPVNPGELKSALKEGPERFSALLRNIRNAVQARIIDLPVDAPHPTIILPIDQAEELFSADATEETHGLLDLIGTVLRNPLTNQSERHMPIIVVFTIRSDRYERLQTAPELVGLKTVLFDALRPMPPAQFKDIIEKPASRALVNGKQLKVAAELVSQLLNDCTQGADTLPLLGLTMARLYRAYGTDGDLRLDEYRDMGGMTDVITTEAESILSIDPSTRSSQLKLLHAAFIPSLATINTDNDQLMRRVARMSDLPKDSRPLIQALIEKRLLLSDQRNGEQIVEVAHESLLRQWKVLADWLESERDDLKEADRLVQEANTWNGNGKKEAWLREGERLSIGEALAAKPTYQRRLEAVREFLFASRAREDDRRKKEEHQRQAELLAAKEKQAAAESLAAERLRATELAQADAARLKKRRNQLMGLVFVTVIVALLTGWFAWKAEQASKLAEQQFKQATALRLNVEAQAELSGARPGGPMLGLSKLLAAHRIAPHIEIEAAMLAQVFAFERVQKIIEMGSPVMAVAFSPDGRRLASSNLTDQMLWLWDAQTGHPIGAALKGHTQPVTSVAFSPNGRLLTSGSEDHTLRLWDAQTGEPVETPLKGHKGRVTSISFSPNSHRLASGSDDATIRLWDTQTGQPIGTPLKGHADSVSSVAFSPDGARLASGSDDATIQLWDTQTGQPIGAPLKGHKTSVRSVAFSPDSRHLASGSMDFTLRLWNAQTGQPIGAPLQGHTSSVTSVAFSPDGRRLASGSWDETVRLWDARTGQPIGAPLKVTEGSVSSVAFSPDGTRLASGKFNNTLMLWDTRTAQPIGVPLKGTDSSVSSVAFSPDGRRLVSGSEDDTLRLWDAQTGQPIGAPLQGHTNSVTSVAFSPDGTRLVSGSDDTTLMLWDAQTSQPIGAPLQGHTSSVTSVAFSPDGTRLVSGSDDTTLMLWDAQTRQPVGSPLKGHTGSVLSVAFSPNGRRLASGSTDQMLWLWDAQTGQPIGAPLQGHTDSVTSVAFSPDGTHLASGSLNGTLRIWDIQTGQSINAPQGHRSPIRSVAFSPDGRRLASGSTDQMLRLWDAQTGQPIGAPLQGHTSSVTSVAFSPDGTRLVSGSEDETLRLWPAPDAWPNELCAKLTQNMSRKQWRDQVSPAIEYQEQCPGLPIPPDAPSQLPTPAAAGEIR